MWLCTFANSKSEFSQDLLRSLVSMGKRNYSSIAFRDVCTIQSQVSKII